MTGPLADSACLSVVPHWSTETSTGSTANEPLGRATVRSRCHSVGAEPAAWHPAHISRARTATSHHCRATTSYRLIWDEVRAWSHGESGPMGLEAQEHQISMPCLTVATRKRMDRSGMPATAMPRVCPWIRARGYCCGLAVGRCEWVTQVARLAQEDRDGKSS